MPSHHLILIKHAPPQVDPTRPSDDWVLSDVGRSKARDIVAPLRNYRPQIVITSVEPKASETGQIIAGQLAIPCKQAIGLHEHDRSNVPVMRTGEFISAVAQFFKERDRVVLGKESANEVAERFDAAIERVLALHPDQTVAVVTHGTALALHAAPLLKTPPFDLWRQLGLPSFLVFDREDMRLIDRMDKLAVD